MNDQSIPKQELLVKLLRMTESDNDNEALMALRRANSLLRSAGWDWEKLIQGKIKIVADPFSGVGVPKVTPRTEPAPPRPAPAPPPKTMHTASRGHELSGFMNKYPGHCYCCGIEVIATAGFSFKPSYWVPSARGGTSASGYAVACSTCNSSGTVRDYPAAPQRKKGKTAVADLA